MAKHRFKRFKRANRKKKPRRKKPRKKNRGKKLVIKRVFKNAMNRLRRMKASKQRAVAVGASNHFIRDISQFMSQIRKRPDLVKKASHRQTLKRFSKQLRKLVHAKTPIHVKRSILLQKGGFLPFLIPIITAIIGAGGAVASGAVHAAISKS